MPDFLLVTRHQHLKEFLYQEGLIESNTPCITHATMDQVRGKNVIGNLPMHLAAQAASIMSITINVPVEKRGSELTVEELREYTTDFCWYRVTEIDPPFMNGKDNV